MKNIHEGEMENTAVTNSREAMKRIRSREGRAWDSIHIIDDDPRGEKSFQKALTDLHSQLVQETSI